MCQRAIIFQNTTYTAHKSTVLIRLHLLCHLAKIQTFCDNVPPDVEARLVCRSTVDILLKKLEGDTEKGQIVKRVPGTLSRPKGTPYRINAILVSWHCPFNVSNRIAFAFNNTYSVTRKSQPKTNWRAWLGRIWPIRKRFLLYRTH